MMQFSDYIFYFFSSILILASLKVITANNPVYSALSLVLAFFSAAGIWLLLHAEFLAIALVLVYVGAVMVLFLFVVMMLDINLESLKKGFWGYFPFAILIAGVFIVEIYLVVSDKFFLESQIESFGPSKSNTHSIGNILYTDYLLPFQIAAVILLVAIISAIALTMFGHKSHKAIDPKDQIKVKRNDRIRIVKMKSEKR
jgi:NADH-quinone oxidoreductase subunit J